MMKSQENKILNALFTNGQNAPGVTTRRLADRAGVPLTNVYKRIHDLRNEGYTIYTNTRRVNGKLLNYYRIAV